MKHFQWILLILLTTLSCLRENDYDYPLIQTGQVTDIDSTGAVFHARITESGKTDILEYGFVWSLTENPDLNSSYIHVTDIPHTGSVSIRIKSDLISDTIYFVRAFARTENYKVYGKTVIFRSKGSFAPVIFDFNPKEGSDGTQVIITGNGFSNSLSGNLVKFGKAAAIVDEASSDKLIVTLPSDLKVSGSVNISVETGKKLHISDSKFKLTGCDILCFEPKELIGGDIIRVKAENFSAGLANNSIRIGDKEAKIAGINNDTIYAYIPFDASIGNNEVSLTSNGKSCYLSNLVVKNPWKIIDNSSMIIDYPGYGEAGEVGFAIGNEGYLGLGTLTKNMWKFGPDNFNWTMGSPELPTGERLYGVAFSAGGKGYVCFGYGDHFYNDMYEFDPIRNTWTKKADFPGDGRERPVSLVIGDKAYLGLGSNIGSPVLKDFWEYDTRLDQWTRLADYPGNDGVEPVGFEVNNIAYIGMTCDQSYNNGPNDFWEYEPLTNAWTRIADFPGSIRYRSTGFSIGQSGFVGSGERNGAWLNDFWRYDVKRNKWIRIADIPQEVPFDGTRQTLSFVINDYGYICSGIFSGYNLIEFDPNGYPNE